MGREITEEYDSKSPLGGVASDFEDSDMVFDEEIDDNAQSLSFGDSLPSHEVNRNGTVHTAGRPTRSNNLIMDEDRFYDEHGNELTTTNY